MNRDPSEQAKLKAAVIQMNSGDDCVANLDEALGLLSAAVNDGAQLLVLPENFLCFGNSGLARLNEQLDGILVQLKAFTREHQVALVAGSIAHASLEKPGYYFSRSLLINPLGGIEAAYDKCHLFDVDVADEHARYRESDTYLAGREAVSATVLGHKLGMSICYDLRFPNLYQALRAQGADLITVPSAFTAVTGKAHWEILLRARAIETQCFVLAANQVGDHGKGRQTWGHSMIIDPWGEILVECDAGPGYGIAELNLQRLQEIRSAIPVQMHGKQFG